MTTIDDLPVGWRLAKIKDLYASWGGLTPSKAKSSYWGGDIPWVSSREIKFERLRGSTFFVTQQAIDESRLRLCPVGSVLVVVRSGILAHTLPVAITEIPVTINQDLKAFYSEEPLMNEWLALFLRLQGSELLASSRRDGTTVQSLQYPLLLNTEMPVPPLNQRRQIIEAIEVLSAQRAAISPYLDTGQNALTRLRRAILAAACTGRLTEMWRIEHEQPEWRHVSAQDICAKVQSGGTPKTGFTDKPGIPFLKVYNIVDQHVDFSYRPQYVPEDVHSGVLRKSVAYPGDVIMNIVGPPLGKVAIIPDTYPEWNLNQAITIFRPSSGILGEWLYIYLCSGIFLDDEDLVTRGSAGQSNISLTQCRNLIIPVASLDEQREIIRRVSDILSTVENLSGRVAAAHRAVERTNQAILAKAFRGDLSATPA